jgi:hypothetical protein
MEDGNSEFSIAALVSSVVIKADNDAIRLKRIMMQAVKIPRHCLGFGLGHGRPSDTKIEQEVISTP